MCVQLNTKEMCVMFWREKFKTCDAIKQNESLNSKTKIPLHASMSELSYAENPITIDYTVPAMYTL